MTTPSFVPQDESTLVPIRYYTPFDPYFHTVDNRPLQDIASNLNRISTLGSDSARRAVLLTQLALSRVMDRLYGTNTAAGTVEGLTLNFPGPGTIAVGAGAVYTRSLINTEHNRQIVKQALYLGGDTFDIPSPSAAGNTVIYIIQGQVVNLTTASMGTAKLPYVDADNTSLPCLLLNGELRIGIKAGVAVTTGSQVAPQADSGWFPIYEVQVTHGQEPTVKLAPEAPRPSTIYRRSLETRNIEGGGAGSAVYAGISYPTLLKSTPGAVDIRGFSTQELNLNPHLPIKVGMVIATNAPGGNAAVSLAYMGVRSGTSNGITQSFTSTSVETVALPTSEGSTSSVTLTATIPNTAFAGKNSANNWAVNRSKLYIRVGRSPASSIDTAAGDLTPLEVIVYQ